MGLRVRLPEEQLLISWLLLRLFVDFDDRWRCNSPISNFFSIKGYRARFAPCIRLGAVINLR